MAVSLVLEDGIARIAIDNPPINALSQEVRAGLMARITEMEQMPDVRGVILTARGRCFVAGADINELGKPLTKPYLPDVLNRIARSPIPWVASINGVALGGGLEIALACHGRVAAAGARLGLPEVSLGLIPGAGGTVRLPRLIPVVEAVRLITSGKPVDAQRAFELGLVDDVSKNDLDVAALSRLKSLIAGGMHIDAGFRRPVDPPSAAFWTSEKQSLERRSRGQKSPLEALEALYDSVEKPDAEAALKAERARFLRLLAGEEAAALRYVFFAERAAGRRLERWTDPAADLTHIGVIGGGTMGAGISAALLLAGSQVTLVEQSMKQAQNARERVYQILDTSKTKGKLDKEGARRAMEALKTTDRYSDLSNIQLVIEAVFEDVDVKAAVFAELDAILAKDAILATNTSYLDVDALAKSTQDPSRVIGLHFFSPAYAMKLLEVVKGEHSSGRSLSTAAALARHLRKTAVVSGVCDGFIANRIMARYRAECELMLEEGTMPQDVDHAMRDFGYAMGVFEVQDLAGLDIAWAMRKRRGALKRQSRIPDLLCEAGRFGRKTGAGWYRYADGKAEPDPSVEEVIHAERARQGRTPYDFSGTEIMDRILTVMQDEGGAILAEGIAQTESDIDVAMILGHGFPRHKGGPMFMRTEAS